MTQKIDSKDLKLAYLIAEYRLLTVKQIAVLEGAHVRTVRRRMSKLFCLDYVIERKRVVRGQSGRPEFIYSLSQKGVQRLHEKGALEEEHSYDKRILNQGLGAPIWIQDDGSLANRVSILGRQFALKDSSILSRMKD